MKRKVIVFIVHIVVVSIIISLDFFNIISRNVFYLSVYGVTVLFFKLYSVIK